MKKLFKTILIVAAIYLLLLFFGPKHLQNGLKYWFSNVDDYKKFENNTIVKSTLPRAWKQSSFYNKTPLTEEMESFFKERQTCAFLVIQDGKIINEHYYEDYNRNTISGSFSMAKTVNAMLIGKLIEQGKIASVNDDVKKYVPQLKQIPNGVLTLKDVLTMSASFDWKESYWNIFSMTAESYYGEDLDKLLAKIKMRKDEKPGTIWEYQSICTQTLGYIIKNVSGMSVADFATQQLWQPLGMENDALWSIDKKEGIEKSFCCINATARDFAKLGQLFLDKGKVDSTQIINENWLTEMTKPASYLKTKDGRTCDWYGYQMWMINYNKLQIPYFRGVHGQFIFVIPEKNAIIVRLGKKIKKQNVDAHEQNDDIKTYIKFGLSLLDE
ncbi:MAG: serine hydrolase [Chitinophagales bacterium]|nr:serine hydrolase [Chitinophagales bacterium]